MKSSRMTHPTETPAPLLSLRGVQRRIAELKGNHTEQDSEGYWFLRLPDGTDEFGGCKTEESLWQGVFIYGASRFAWGENSTGGKAATLDLLTSLLDKGWRIMGCCADENGGYCCFLIHSWDYPAVGVRMSATLEEAIARACLAALESLHGEGEENKAK